ncbi:MAG: type II toxin-antitoxin system RelE/ParE family toxin [Castellaniella sp.]|uniref:type II toxin-antitoxin system RelE/ParE family toxin n=1 Tax=Castellaniella sp. TaxID=1955812 RepID=UPI0011F512EA|nr:type II toxin-antitoxin system RelE/ParE family toxin [Castellaniella sp.]TAN25469.1 MAG: type II toxin-antitoxin system RelE/ParE family toxin [Castellaniella sp.]
MKELPVVPRAMANRDVDEAIQYYLQESAVSAALGFIDELERAYAHLSRHPAMGSTRYAYELDLPDLRCWSLGKYPYLVFYVTRADYVDVWRVLHAVRDIPPMFCDPDALSR